jgi:histone H3/H4
VIPQTSFRRLVCEIVREEEPDYRMESAAVNALQLAAEVYVTTFLAGMTTFYLSHKFITHYSISASNLAAQHAGRVTIMEKDFLHVRRIGFLLGARADNPDFNDTRKAEYIIQQYDAGKEFPGLSQAQRNKVDAILTIRDFE